MLFYKKNFGIIDTLVFYERYVDKFISSEEIGMHTEIRI